MPKVSIYDPFVDAFREVDVDKAQKFLDQVPSVQAQLDALKPAAPQA